MECAGRDRPDWGWDQHELRYSSEFFDVPVISVD